MRRTIEKLYNELAQTELSVIILIEKSDKQPICVICGKELNNHEWCYFCKEFKEFGCSDCVVEGEIQGMKTGFKISKLSSKYQTNVNVAPILLRFA